MQPGALDHRSTLLRLSAAVTLAVAFTFGCAATPPPKPVVTAPAPTVERVDTGASYYEGEIGGMNEYAVDDAFKALSGRIQQCFESGTERVEALGGSFTVSFRVDRK